MPEELIEITILVTNKRLLTGEVKQLKEREQVSISVSAATAVREMIDEKFGKDMVTISIYTEVKIVGMIDDGKTYSP